ncbi:MAG: CoA-binding protein, partial [Deltaproteobacteria bacterium]|nr:CoA-binding protein [Deltaproteobacteria bacterium]
MLSKIFYPSRILILGVSGAAGNLGRNIAANLVEFGFGGEIHLYGRSGGNLFGHRIHTNLDDVPAGADLAVVLLPARAVPDALEKLGETGVRHAVIETGGFAERGGEGGIIQDRIKEIAERYGIRVVGPNCVGVMNPEAGLATAFVFVRKMWRKGDVAVIAQSGGVGVSYLYLLASENIGISKFASVGNKMNTDEKDYLEYLTGDPATKIIVMYLESIARGREFFNLLRATSKPVLIQKANRTDAGKKIAFSHTAALSQDNEVVDAAIWQAGGIIVNSTKGMMSHIKSFLLPPANGDRIGIIARSGGHAVISADSANENGFALPEFDGGFLEKINSLLPAGIIKRQNPLDLGDLYNFEIYAKIMTEIIKLDYIDALVMVHEYFAMFEGEESRKLVPHAAALSAEYRKPVYLVLFAEEEEIAAVKKKFTYPVFSSIEEAFQAASARYRFEIAKINGGIEDERAQSYDREEVRGIIEGEKKRGAKLITLKGFEILRNYSVKCPF